MWLTEIRPDRPVTTRAPPDVVDSLPQEEVEYIIADRTMGGTGPYTHTTRVEYYLVK